MIRSDIHFVCTGNTCRSPMAEGITRYYLLEAGLGDRWSVSSSGLAAMPGDPVSENSRIVLDELGVDMSEHRSARTSPYAVERARYVFAMTRGHLDHLRRLFPEARDRILLFSDVVARGREVRHDVCASGSFRPVEDEIRDPYGLDLARYRMVAQTIGFYARFLVLLLQSEGSGPGNHRSE